MAIEDLEKVREKTQYRSGSEAVENGRKGGIASGTARRRKKSLREAADLFLSLDSKGAERKQLEKAGVDPEDADNQMAVIAGLTKKAVKGDAKAAKVLADIVGVEDSKDGAFKHWDIPARVVGRAFIDLIRDIKPNISYVLEGGRGSTKSSIISIICIWAIKNYPDIHACVTRQVAGTLKDSVYAQIKWAINVLGLNDEFEATTHPLEITYKPTKQKIYFRGLDDETKLKSIKPEFGYIGFLWKEEKDQMKGAAQERSINQSVLRGGTISFDFSSYNPPKSKDSWVNKEKLIDDPNRIIHHSTYLDTPPDWLGQKFIDDAEHLKEVNPEAYEHEYLGVPNGSGGNVFEFLEIREIPQEEYDSYERIYQGADWGWYPDPYAFIRLNYDPAHETITLLDEHYVNKEPNSQTGQWIIDKGYTDYEITCDSAEPKSVGDYRNMSIPARKAIKGPGSIEYGMKWLQGKKIIIDPARTPNAYKEFSGYEYERDKEGNVVSGYPDADNHLIDATRYALERVWRRRGNSA